MLGDRAGSEAADVGSGLGVSGIGSGDRYASSLLGRRHKVRLKLSLDNKERSVTWARVVFAGTRWCLSLYFLTDTGSLSRHPVMSVARKRQ